MYGTYAGSHWCDVVWCGVVCQRRCYQMAMAVRALHMGNASRRAVCVVVRCVLCVAHLYGG